MTDAVIYCRVSSKRQLTEGHGNDAQEHICRKFAADRGYRVLEVFQEPGISGALTVRPAMSEMIAFLRQRKGKQTAVIIDDLKRFSRDVGGYWELKQLIGDCNAQLASPKHEFSESPEGTFIQTMLVATGQLEREQNRRQVIEKMKARIERGYWPFPCRLPGYQTVKEAEHGKVLRRKDPEAAIIAEALNGYANGTIENQVAIQRFLLDRRIKQAGYLSYVRRILDNSLFYAGQVEYLKWDVARRPGHHDALITLETHIKIIERTTGKLRSHVRRDLNEDFPHRGFIACAQCDKLMTASWSRGRRNRYPYYRCTEPTCPYFEKSINRDRQIEPEFRQLLTQVAPTPETLGYNKMRMLTNWQRKMVNVEQRYKDINEEIRDTEKSVELLVEKAEKSINVKATQAYERKMEKLELYRAALEEKRDKADPARFDFGTALNSVVKFLSNPLATWLEDDLRKQHMLLKMMFLGHVPYHPKKGFGTAKFSLTYAVLSGISPLETPYLLNRGHGRN